MGRALYIIGNGFDLHHGIPSSYAAFGRYLEARDSETYQILERYFALDFGFWFEFEDRLASFDSDFVLEDMSQFLASYGADDWSDSGHQDFQYEVGRVVGALTETLRARFGDWIRQLPIPTPVSFAGRWAKLDPAALYLTFNYTPTLQRLYGIPEAQVLHIHGSAADLESQLILGHGWEPGDLDPYRVESEPENADMRVIEGIEIVDGYFKNTCKPTARIIETYRQNFAALSDVTEIVVLGHSLAEVDHPYFEALIANIDVSKVRWRVSVFDDLDYKTNCIRGFGIPPYLIQFGSLSEL